MQRLAGVVCRREIENQQFICLTLSVEVEICQMFRNSSERLLEMQRLVEEVRLSCTLLPGLNL